MNVRMSMSVNEMFAQLHNHVVITSCFNIFCKVEIYEYLIIPYVLHFIINNNIL